MPIKGSIESNTIYIWGVDIHDWVNIGSIKGPVGPQGEPGTSAYTSAQTGGYSGTEAQFYTDLAQVNQKEDTSNKVTSISESSTDDQYPTAKCLYTLIGTVESELHEL